MTTCNDCILSTEPAGPVSGVIFCPKHAVMIEEHPKLVAEVIPNWIRQLNLAHHEAENLRVELAASQAEVGRLKRAVKKTDDSILAKAAEVERLKAEKAEFIHGENHGFLSHEEGGES